MGDWDVVGQAPMGEWDVVSHEPSVPAPQEPADHGRSERAAYSPFGTSRMAREAGAALTPITGYWDTYKKMNREAQDLTAEGFHQMTHPDDLTSLEGHGLWDIGAGAVKTGMGALGYVGSPISAAYRSLLGQPLEDVTGLPREYTEFAAQLATPGIGFTKLPKAPGTPLIEPRLPPPTSEAADRARALGEEFNLKYSKGQAENDLERLKFEDMAARGAHGKEVQNEAAPFFNQQFEDVQQAGRNVGQQLSRGEQPLNSATDAGASLNTVIADEAAQARAVRDKALQSAEQTRLQQQAQADEQLVQRQQQAEQEVARQRQLAEQRAQTITEGVAGQHPTIGSTREAGEAIGQGIRDAAEQNRNEFRGLYNQFGQMEGTFELPAVRSMGTRLRDELSGEVVIDDHLTPAASKAIQMLDEMSSRPSIPNRATPRTPLPADAVIAGVNLQGIDRMRRHLVAFYKAAQRGSEDQRAVRAIMQSFDGQIEHAITSGLFSGDPRALEVLQNARASYARYRQTFGPTRAGDDVGLAMQRIVDRHATPEEIANMVVGSGKLGNAGLPVRIADRLETVLGADSPEFNSVRQAIWQKASQVRNAAGEFDPLKSANSIRDFAGSSLAQRHFSAAELSAMRNHAEGLRRLDAVMDSLPSSQKAAVAAHKEATKAAEAAHAEATAKAHAMYEDVFGGGEMTGGARGVFQRMGEGKATPEETANAFFSVLGEGKPAHASRALNAIERIVGKDSPVMGTIRQGVWQKLTQNAFGKDPAGQQKLAQSINEFLNGSGRTIAKQLYTDEERALMGRYAEAVKRTVIPRLARTNSDTAPTMMAAALGKSRRHLAAITAAIGASLHGGVTGGLEGYAVGKLIDKASERLGQGAVMRKLQESIENAPPKPPKQNNLRIPKGVLPLSGIGLATGGPVARRAPIARDLKPRTTPVRKESSPFQQRVTNPYTG